MRSTSDCLLRTEIKNKFMKEFDQSDSVYIFKLSSSCETIKFGYAKNEDDTLLIVQNCKPKSLFSLLIKFEGDCPWKLCFITKRTLQATSASTMQSARSIARIFFICISSFVYFMHCHIPPNIYGILYTIHNFDYICLADACQFVILAQSTIICIFLHIYIIFINIFHFY